MLSFIEAIGLLFLMTVAVMGLLRMERRDRSRRSAQLAECARTLGLRYSSGEDQRPVLDKRFKLAGCAKPGSDVIEGRWRGLPMAYADFIYPAHPGKTARYSVLCVTLSIEVPYLTVSRRYDREIRVKSPDGEFAETLMSADMTAWLRSASMWLRLEMGGSLLAITCHELPDPKPLFDLAAEFVAHIPETILN